MITNIVRHISVLAVLLTVSFGVQATCTRQADSNRCTNHESMIRQPMTPGMCAELYEVRNGVKYACDWSNTTASGVKAKHGWCVSANNKCPQQ